MAEIGDWETLCENLNVPKSVVKNLLSESMEIGKKRRKCLEAYLNLGNACWETVVRVVADHPFDNKMLAKKIAAKYGVDYQTVVQLILQT